METQKTKGNESNSKQYHYEWYHYTQFQIIVESYSSKNSIIVTPKQTHKPLEQNIGPSINLWNNSQLIFEKDAKNRHWEREGVINKWCCQTELHVKKTKLELIFYAAQISTLDVSSTSAELDALKMQSACSNLQADVRAVWVGLVEQEIKPETDKQNLLQGVPIHQRNSSALKWQFPEWEKCQLCIYQITVSRIHKDFKIKHQENTTQLKSRSDKL